MDRRNIVIGTLLLLLGATFYFGFLNYREVFKIDNKGYLFSSKLIIDKLNTPELTESDSIVKYELAKENEAVYKKGFKYYIGENKKKEIYLDLPAISDDASRVTNLTNTGLLITKEFKVYPSFDNSILTDGALYNGTSLDRVDREKYILIKSASNIYVNSPKLNIEINGKDVEIKENSVINFLENEIRYYYLDDGKFKYKRIGGISLDDFVKYFDDKITYKDFLVNLNIIGDLEFDKEILPDIEGEIRPPYIRPDPDIDTGEEEYVYIKPNVSGNIVSTNVYSFETNVTIEDPARRIEQSPTIEVKLGNRIYVKKVFYSNGKFDVIGLLPNTEFEIVGYYTYRDEKDKLRKYTFIDQKIKTNDITNLEHIKLLYENDEMFPDKIEFKNMALKNNEKDEVLKGLKRIDLKVGDKTYPLSNKTVGLLKSLKLADYKTPSSLDSNTTYDVEFKFYDIADNELIAENATTRVKTSKQIPTVDIEIKETDLTFFKADIDFDNPDDVFMDNLKYVVTDNKNNIIISDKLLSNDILVDDLDVNKIYNLIIYGDYDIEDGKGIVKDKKIRSVKISTKPISTLGFIRLIMDEKNILQNSANYTVEINKPSTDEKLIELLTGLQIKIINKDTEEIDDVIYITGDDITNLKNSLSYDLDIKNLTSKTKYEIEITAVVQQGSKKFSVNGLSNVKEFKTLKQEAVVEITNKYSSENLIDFDVRIQDVDGAILSNRVMLEVRDSSGTLVGFEHVDINDEYIRLTYDKLTKDEDYTFKYYAEEYNVGYNNATYIQDKILFTEVINTSRGIYGEIYLESLLKQITSRNLFDISNNTRWKKDGSSTISERTLDIENNIIRMASRNGYATYGYYLPEGTISSLKVSFKIRHTNDSNAQGVYLSNGAGSNKQYPLDDLSTEWKEFEFSFVLNSNMYLGFYINEIANNNTVTEVEVKDLIVSKQEYNTNPGLNESIYDIKHIFEDTKMYRGNEEMPTITGGVMPYNNMSNGYAKITNTNTNQVFSFDYTGDEQLFRVPEDGTYKVELWGASGGGDGFTEGSRAGRGGYSAGNIVLKANTNLYVYVGGAGKYGPGISPYGGGPVGGFNGGGNGGNKSSGSGGGATDIRLKSLAGTTELESLKTRIIVAGGGGGSDDMYGMKGSSNDGSGGDGGGVFSLGPTIDGVKFNSYAAYQIPINGSIFGLGGDVKVSTDTGGGGGGYYGGVATNHNNGGGGGGSSYISGHIGCIAYSKAAISDDNEEVPLEYSEKATYNATLYASIEDTKNELVEKEFYIQIFRDGILKDTVKYDMNNLTKIENVLINYDVDKNTNYEITLAVKIRDRYYAIDTAYFTTEEEIRSIKTVSDFTKMHHSGKYLVLNDLDFTDVHYAYESWFKGKIDFQGNDVHIDTTDSQNCLIRNVSNSALIENLNVHFYLNNETARSWYYGLFYDFRGTLRNLKLTVEESTEVPNVAMSLVAYANRGIIENFVINNKAGMSGSRIVALGVSYNYGTLRNGYLYGEALDASFPTNYPQESKRMGALTAYTSSNSVIENIFSLVAVDGVNPEATENPSIDDRVGSLIGENARTKMSNVYTYTSGENRTLTRDANIGIGTNVSGKNIFYISDEIYNPAPSLKVPKSALRDKDFHEALNGDDKFNIDDFVEFGFFPQIIWPDCMPNQDYIELPEVNDADLVDIISVKEAINDEETALVTLIVNNPSSDAIIDVGIKDIGLVEILEQTNIEGGKSEVKLRLSEPMRYVSKYYLKSITSKNNFGRDYTREYDDNERALLIDMYRMVNNIPEFKNIQTYPTENFMLTTDLDFKNTPASYFYISKLSGKLNGDGHTIKNIEIATGAGFMGGLSGELKNIFIENVNRLETNVYDRNGVIGYLYYGGIIDNVHVKNIKLYASNRMGGLVGYSDGGIIRNSSVTNPTVNDISIAADADIGGLVGEMLETSIDNCFVQNINFDLTGVKSLATAGGLVGNASSGSISNAYTTGNIETKFPNAGGISGYNGVSIQSVYSITDVTSKADYIGGIAGKTTTDNISNSISIGKIYSHLIDNNIKRIAGNMTIVNNNYAWDNQYINGQASGVINGEKLLTREQLSNRVVYEETIKMSENFNYDDLENGKLPKLYANDGKTLLPNQIDNHLPVYDFEVVDIITKKSVTDAYVQLEINNPNLYEIKNIKVNGMNIDIRKNENLGTSTYIEFLATPEKAYDSYKLYEFTYVKNGEEIVFDTAVKIDAKFYKDLEKFEDWQKISKTDAENYRLVADIDFTGKTNINHNVLFNRLEGTGSSKKVLKNIDTTFEGSHNGLINSVISNFTNIEFDNVTITNPGWVERNGLISYVYGKVSNLSFRNITLNLDNASFAAIISTDRSYDLRDIDLYNIYVRGRGYTSGFIGASQANGITNITFEKLDVLGYGTYTAGILAWSSYVWAPNIFNISGRDARVEGRSSYIGGVFGYSGGKHIDVSYMDVIGYGVYTGGVAGFYGVYEDYYARIKNSTVKGYGNHVGGITGAGYSTNHVHVDNVDVKGMNSSVLYVGGIVGGGGYGTYYSTIKNSTVTSLGDYVGGVRGALSWSVIHSCSVLDTTVTGRKYVGGLVGAVNKNDSAGTINHSITNAEVTATELGAGGILGYSDNSKADELTNRTLINNVIAANTTVTAPILAGGFIGRVDKAFPPGHINNVIISSNVFNTNTSSKSAIIGSSDYYTSSVNDIRIYDNSTLNGERIGTDYGLREADFVTAGDLAKSSTYTSIGLDTYYYDLSKLADGKFPFLRYVQPDYKQYFPLPNSPSILDLSDQYMMARMTFNTNYFHMLPTYNIYVSDVDKINVEFRDVDKLSNISVNGIKHPVNKKVFSYQYNFKDDIEITISDGVNSSTKKYKAKDLKNNVYTNKNKYYLIDNNKLITNGKKLKDKVVNIYNNKALLENGSVINLDNHKIQYMVYEKIKKLDHEKELYNFEFNGLTIDTFYHNSYVEGKEMDNQLFVKNNRIEMLQGGTSSLLESIIIDNYNDKNFLTILSSEGYIYNLKDKISFPDKFDNFKIKKMSNNLTNDSNIIAIEYENGDFLVFNYRNGEVIYKNYKNNTNIFEYYQQTFKAKTIANEEIQKLNSYNESKKLISNILNDNIIVTDDKTTPIYIPVYKASKNDYDIYDITSLTNKNVDNIDSVNNSITDKINNNVDYKDHYINNPVEKKSSTNSVVIFVMILIGIILSILLLGRNIKFKKHA